MLVTLESMKTSLDIASNDTTYDDFLTEQLNLISEAVELYCGRSFKKQNFTEVIYADELNENYLREIMLYHYPVSSITSFTDKDGEAVTDYRLVKATGILRKKGGFVCSSEDELTVQYKAGYDMVPFLIQSVVKTLVTERYNKKVAGVDLNFGTDVQRIAIPGTISIDYDFTLQNNDQSVALGTIIGNQANILDQFKSERKIIGTLRYGYVY